MGFARTTEIARLRSIKMLAAFGDRHGPSATLASDLAAKPACGIAQGIADLLVSCELALAFQPNIR